VGVALAAALPLKVNIGAQVDAGSLGVRLLVQVAGELSHERGGGADGEFRDDAVVCGGVEEEGRLELVFNAQDVAGHDIKADRLGRFAPLECRVLEADRAECLGQLSRRRCDK